MKVICNAIGSTHLCDGCGAAKLHYQTSCEPCPVNAEAKCVDPTNLEDEDESLWSRIEDDHFNSIDTII